MKYHNFLLELICTVNIDSMHCTFCRGEVEGAWNDVTFFLLHTMDVLASDCCTVATFPTYFHGPQLIMEHDSWTLIMLPRMQNPIKSSKDTGDA
jgi:hypothetical protein